MAVKQGLFKHDIHIYNECTLICKQSLKIKWGYCFC